jgi:hypothetical protein
VEEKPGPPLHLKQLLAFGGSLWCGFGVLVLWDNTVINNMLCEVELAIKRMSQSPIQRAALSIQSTIVHNLHYGGRHMVTSAESDVCNSRFQQNYPQPKMSSKQMELTCSGKHNVDMTRTNLLGH